MELLQDFFENVAEKEITTEQLREIIDLKYPDRSPVFNVKDPNTMIEILSMFKDIEYEDVMEFLHAITLPTEETRNESYLVLESPLLVDARKSVKYKREILSRDPPGAKSIAGKCYRCGFDQLLMTSVQTRSGDEGITNIYFCPNCRNTWRS